MRGIRNNYLNKKFGRLLVLSFEGQAKNYIALWRCRCECGKEVVVRGPNLANGNSSTCGCVHGVVVSDPITHEQLLALVRYEAWTGKWFRILPGRGCAAGEEVGVFDRSNGYIVVSVEGQRYFSHVLAYFYETGCWPNLQIDHKDRDRANNRWLNLRLATQSQNNGNISKRIDNTSGYKGVSFDRSGRNKPWRAHIKSKTFGYFETAIEAAQAYDDAAIREFGEFSRTNFGGRCGQ